MLPSITTALQVKARRNAAIARDLGRNPETVTKWFSGKYYIPKRVRVALDEAIGCAVDWEAYEADYAADNDRRYAAKAEAILPAPEPVAAPAPKIAPAPVKIAATAPRRLTASPPMQKPPTRPQAVPAASAPKPGFLSRFLASDPGELFQ